MREFFKTLPEAVAWGRALGNCVIGIYGLDKPGTVRRFQQEQAEALHYGHDYESYRAVVAFIR